MRITSLTAAAAALVLAACQPADEDAAAAAAPAAATPAAAVPEPAATTPEEHLAALYAAEPVPAEPTRLRRFFTDEVAAALAPNADGERGADRDYRYGARNAAVGTPSFWELAAGPDGALVEARFGNAGGADAVQYTLCRRDDGQWRITEVSHGAGGPGADGAWSLRRSLGLPAEPGPDC